MYRKNTIGEKNGRQYFFEGIDTNKIQGSIPGINIGNTLVGFHGIVRSLLICIIGIQNIEKILVICKAFGNVVQVCDNIEHYGFYTKILSFCLFAVMIFQRPCGLVQDKNTKENRDQKNQDKDRQKLFLDLGMLRMEIRMMQ